MTIKDGAWPANVTNPVKKLMENFYQLSNAASTHSQHKKDEEKLASLFTHDGTYEFAGKKAHGHKAIIAFREQLFKNSPHRDHPIVRIYTFGNNDHELMALGIVNYGKEESHEWAGRYSIVNDAGGELKFKHVQIILKPAHPQEH